MQHMNRGRRVAQATMEAWGRTGQAFNLKQVGGTATKQSEATAGNAQLQLHYTLHEAYEAHYIHIRACTCPSVQDSVTGDCTPNANSIQQASLTHLPAFLSSLQSDSQYASAPHEPQLWHSTHLLAWGQPFQCGLKPLGPAS